jgi:alcohol dehydrogenase
MRSDIETLLKMVQEKKLKVLIDKVFPLKEAREALRVIEDREVFGKVVVAP